LPQLGVVSGFREPLYEVASMDVRNCFNLVWCP
jgi:hypothetical protein